ncbi:MAG TPA: ATP-dependent Clp protease ATP-binding subunit [Candidatus Paceibacterota bacterium]|nr:ATP-dependent Clp protease ATP-binding subunit [Candidatus Paceibacterota bacterium]
MAENNFFGNKNIYFYDPRLEMGFVGRLLTRIIIFVFYIALAIAAVLLILTQDSSIRYLGFFLVIFLADRFAHFNEPAKKFDKGFRKQLERGKEINLADYSQDSFKRFLEVAIEKTLLAGGSFYLRLLDEFLALREFQNVLVKLDVKPDEFRYHVHEALVKSESAKKTKKELMEIAGSLALNALSYCRSQYLKPRDLFLALFFINDPEVGRLLTYFNLNPEDLKVAIVFSEFRHKLIGLKGIPNTLNSFVKKFPSRRHRIMNRAWTARPTGYLDSVSTDLTDLAREEKIGFLVGHDNELKRLRDILSRSSKNNALLVGEPGSGKDTVVEHLAYQISKDDVPPELFDKRLVMLSISSLVAGAEPSEVINRSHKVVDEILAAGNVILYIPDIHNLVRTSGEHYLSVADALIPVLNRSDFQVIGACAPQDFKRDIESKTDFISAFEMIPVEEISEEDAIQLLSYEALILEKQFKVNITFRAIKQAVKISHRYFRDKLLPASAEELLKETVANVKNRGEKNLTEDDVISVSQAKIDIPLKEAGAEETQSLLNLEERIHQRLIDQEEAVKAVSRALREYRAGLSRKGGPIANFLFVGPTGVGKTELAKILARLQFGSEENMIRFDMSEYQDRKSIFRFIGTPEGEVGGSLTEAVRQKPYSLVLLDEFEKAYPDILNLFLAVFEDGRLTDNLGRLVDFTNTIIIATSNAHSDVIKDDLEQGMKMSEIAADLKKRLSDYFRPELLNRFSDIIVFKTLAPEDLKKITVILLKEITSILEESQGVEVKFDDSAIDELVKIGYSPIYGARPLRNAIAEKIKSLLADKILRKEFSRGENIVLRFDGENFVIEKT